MPGRNYFILIFVAALIVCRPAACRAGESEGNAIWTGLVLASEEQTPSPVPEELAAYSDQLKNIFGYNQFELLGQRTETIDSRNEHWLVPSEDFSLLVNCKKASRPDFNYRLKLQLFQEKKLLADMDARLAGQNLLFIRGPFYGKGQLVIVLVVK
jgi:hypothetical protein